MSDTITPAPGAIVDAQGRIVRPPLVRLTTGLAGGAGNFAFTFTSAGGIVLVSVSLTFTRSAAGQGSCIAVVDGDQVSPEIDLWFDAAGTKLAPTFNFSQQLDAGDHTVSIVHNPSDGASSITVHDFASVLVIEFPT
jgi:hypothetical protein